MKWPGWRHDILHDDIQHNVAQQNDTQHNDNQYNDTQPNDNQHCDTQQNIAMLLC
jgi:hypothetical protein